MPAPLPLAVRRLIQRRARRGQSAAAIACALGLRPRTVRQLLRHFGEQLERLEPAYQPGPGQPADRHPLYAQALALRQQHPSWGAGYIRVRLAGAADAAVLPSERTLQRWFRQQHQPPAAPGQRALDPDVAGHCPPRHLADGCRGTATPGQRSRRLLAASGRRIQWCLPWHHGFPPTTSGAMSCRPRCSSSCGRRSPAGDCPASCVWTTASRGVRGAICLRPWRCG